MEPRSLYLAVDFDDTLRINSGWMIKDHVPNWHVIKLVQILKQKGWIIILWTCRSIDDELKAWLSDHDVPIDYFNENPHAIDWWERNYGWSNFSNKIYADVYLDDSAINPWNFITAGNDEDIIPEDMAEHLCDFVKKRHQAKAMADQTAKTES